MFVFDGSTYLVAAGAGGAGGNLASTIVFEFSTKSNPGSPALMVGYGTVAATQFRGIYLTSNGNIGITSGTGGAGAAYTGKSYNDGKTHGVVLRNNGANGWYLYVDGVPVLSESWTPSTNAANTFVGGCSGTPGSDTFLDFTGAIGQVAIYIYDVGDTLAKSISLALPCGSFVMTSLAPLSVYWLLAPTAGAAFNNVVGLSCTYFLGHATSMVCNTSATTLKWAVNFPAGTAVQIQAIGAGGAGSNGATTTTGGGGGGGGAYSQTDDGNANLASITLCADAVCTFQVGVASGAVGGGQNSNPGPGDTYMSVPVVASSTWSTSTDGDGNTLLAVTATNALVLGQMVNVQGANFYFSGFVTAAASDSFTVSIPSSQTWSETANANLTIYQVIWAGGGSNASGTAGDTAGQEYTLDSAVAAVNRPGGTGGIQTTGRAGGGGGGASCTNLCWLNAVVTGSMDALNGQGSSGTSGSGYGGFPFNIISGGSGYSKTTNVACTNTTSSGTGFKVNIDQVGGGAIICLGANSNGSGNNLGDQFAVGGGNPAGSASFQLLGWGYGGDGASGATAAPVAGSAPGGGGGGGGKTTLSSIYKTGAAGAGGQIIINWTLPVTFLPAWTNNVNQLAG